MEVVKVFVLLLSVFSLCSCHIAKKAPRYVLNLDLPPEKRWESIVAHWNVTKLQENLQFVIKTEVPEVLIPVVQMIGGNIDKYIPSPYSGELMGMAKAFNMSLGDIVLVNLLYDITAYCTSIVAEDSEGQIWHGRNLDYTFTEMLRDMTFIYDAQRNGTTVYTATTFIGYIGAMTGMRPKAFSISADERDQGKQWENMLELINALLTGQASFVSFLIRDAIANMNNFDEAVHMLSTEQIIAPVYYIIGGMKPGEGAVITRDRLASKDVWKLDSSNERWFLVETNYDHWEPAPQSDDRRDPANKAMNGLTQSGVNATTMYNKVFSLKPVLASHTVYTTTISAAEPDMYNTMVRYDVD
ncbi:N-acylethanolamine-hydrolyzing acid amidase-like [Glandiceps talaboti]